jgi:uncharacterized protein YbgA (DUF1722 family)
MAPVRDFRGGAAAAQKAAGYSSDQLPSEDRTELSEIIDRYRRDQLPLFAPLTLIRALCAQAERQIA